MPSPVVTLSFSEPRRDVGLTPGKSILDAARQNDIDIIATCGARGRCRSCRIKQVDGQLPEATIADRSQLSGDEIREGYRLACQCLPESDAAIAISPPMNETSFQILVETGGVGDQDRPEPQSGVTQMHLMPERPKTEAGKTSKFDVLTGGTGLSPGLETLRDLADLPQNLSEGVTVTRFGEKVLAIEPGDSATGLYGMAFDIGTTTIVGYLMDLETGETVASVSGLNPQTVFGGDLISRIAFAAEDRKNVRRLRSRIIAFLNDLSKEVCASAGVSPKHVYKVVVVGNTCMHHLFLGIDPTSVGQAPYLPVIRLAFSVAAQETGLRFNREAQLFTLPIVAGFVGADAVGMILATGLDRKEGIAIAADIGTNAEVVLKTPSGLYAASSPAGPALEGGQIHDGMRAALGAIDKVTIDEDVRVHTIGDVPALGICGSGLIDAVAALLDAGIIAPSGRMKPEPDPKLAAPLATRLRKGTTESSEFVLVWARESANRADIVLSQGDIRQLQLAKAAILSGVIALLDEAGVGVEDITEFNLAGGFGNYLNLESARRIALIPDISTDKVRYVANAAGLGAQMSLISESERARADTLADDVRHVSLAGHAEFRKIYMKAMGFPKTPSDKS